MMSRYADVITVDLRQNYRCNVCIEQVLSVQCIQFKSDQATDAKKLDELNTFFLSLMAGMDPEEFAASCAAGEQPTQPSPGQTSSTKRNKRKQ